VPFSEDAMLMKSGNSAVNFFYRQQDGLGFAGQREIHQNVQTIKTIDR
jgi:hypothetical protein